MPQTSDDQPAEPKTRHSAAFWFEQLDAAAKREEDFRKKGGEVQCRYLDDRKGYEGGDIYERRINILWSNTELQKGALFANLGNPDVRRAFPKPGRDNKIARTSALVLERALVACGNRYDPECQIEDAVEDNLLPGRGVCWLEYEAEVEQYTEMVVQTDPETGEEAEVEQQAERVGYQDVRICHVEWKDFRHGSAKRWEDVPWVGRLRLFTKEDIEAKWPDMADAVKCDYVVEEEKSTKRGDKDQDFRRARVWEIWYKPKKIRVYVAEGTDAELQRDDDPYRLEAFFPCPKPLYAVKTTSTLTPKSEFLQYKDQADELDRVNTRIWRLLEKLRYCGVYDASGQDSDALENIGNLEDGKFLPYKNFQSLADGKGLASAFQTRDLAPIAVAIQALAERALQLIQSIYEVTGLSDVMRGATDPQETLGAQDLKARFGSTRMQTKQKNTKRFVCALYKMKAELIAEHFEREQLEEMTGIRLPLAQERDQAKALVKASEQAQAAMQQMQQQQAGGQAPGGQPQPPAMAMQPQDPFAGMEAEDVEEIREIADACTWEEVSGILRSDDRRNYKVDVETDAINYAETEEEKKQRLEFVNIMVGLLTQVMMAAQTTPALWTLAKEFVMFAARAFPIGRTLEETIDDTFSQMMKSPPTPPPDPMAEKAKADIALKQQELQMRQQEAAQSMQMDQAKNQQSMAHSQQEFELKSQSQQADLVFKQQELALKERELQIKEASLLVDQRIKEQDAAFRSQEAERRFSLDAETQQHSRMMAEHGASERAEERGFKQRDMDERRQADIQDKEFRREVETDVLRTRAGKQGDVIDDKAFEARRSQVEENVSAQIDELSQQFAASMQDLQSNQMQIAQILQAIKADQDEMTDAVTAVVGHMAAPRKVKRDPATGRAVGVEVGEAEGDVKSMLARLKQGRSLVRGADNRVEGF